MFNGRKISFVSPGKDIGARFSALRLRKLSQDIHEEYVTQVAAYGVANVLIT